jgi:hypothetical protein
MEGEITDSNGVTWTCVQAYSGLDNNATRMQRRLISYSNEAIA